MGHHGGLVEGWLTIDKHNVAGADVSVHLLHPRGSFALCYGTKGAADCKSTVSIILDVTKYVSNWDMM